MKNKPNFTLRASALLLIFIVEMIYAGVLVLRTNNPETIRTISALPVVGDWYYEQQMAEIRIRAESGDVSAMIFMHDKALFLDRAEDVDAAISMLRTGESATADMFLYLLEHTQADGSVSDVDFLERETMLLQARVMRENIRPPIPDMRGEEFVRQSTRHARSLTILLDNAQKGDETATWIIENLYRR